jgi:hypothetical protein
MPPHRGDSTGLARFREASKQLMASSELAFANPVRGSSCDSSLIARGHEQTGRTDLEEAELARAEQGALAPQIFLDLFRS